MAKALFKSIDWYVHVAFIVSFALIIISFFMPPMGKIDPSALQAVGELGGTVALVTFLYKLPEYIEKSKSIKFSKGDTSLEVEGKANEKDEEDDNSFE